MGSVVAVGHSRPSAPSREPFRSQTTLPGTPRIRNRDTVSISVSSVRRARLVAKGDIHGFVLNTSLRTAVSTLMKIGRIFLTIAMLPKRYLNKSRLLCLSVM